MSPAINMMVGGGAGSDFYGYDDSVTATSGIGSPASFHPGDNHGEGTHICVGAMMLAAIGILVLFNIGGFRAMVAVG